MYFRTQSPQECPYMYLRINGFPGKPKLAIPPRFPLLSFFTRFPLLASLSSGFLPPNVPQQNLWGKWYSSEGPEALPVTQPTVLKH